ncbi:MAG: (d)CMP kinase [Clostridia bacterium]|nr:(d)CMP kinase [Clostridia bacterium]
MNRISIAIDGPAGAGKSTIAKAIAKKMNILHLDTGAMYRAVGLKAIRLGIPCTDRERCSLMIEDTDIDVSFENGIQRVYADGEDVTPYIRTQEVAKAASDISVHPAVRIKLVEAQRQIAKKYDVVMDGRDIGSYVLPDAMCKIYLTATVTERARRRFLDLENAGALSGRTLDDVIVEIMDRDRVDSTREFSPLMRAGDAIEVDTTNIDAQTAINTVLEIVEGRIR